MRTRNRAVLLRLTDEELSRLRALVKRSGLSQEAYLRSLVAGLRPRDKPPPDYYAMTRELHAIGNNLNQIAAKRRESSRRRSPRSPTPCPPPKGCDAWRLRRYGP